MKIDEIIEAYKYAEEGKNLPEEERVKRNFSLMKKLLSDNDPEIVDFHYSLLSKREYEELYYDVRAAFLERPGVEDYLLKKLGTESDPITLADILHLLGIIESSHAAPLARKFANSDHDYQREIALYVLGWVGNESDITILNNHLLNEESPHLRITAASAHRQLYYRWPELKNELLLSLKKGFEREKDDEVIAWIIIMIESIALKRLGLREDKEDPDLIHGDIQKAKIKTSKFLDELSI